MWPLKGSATPLRCRPMLPPEAAQPAATTITGRRAGAAGAPPSPLAAIAASISGQSIPSGFPLQQADHHLVPGGTERAEERHVRAAEPLACEVLPAEAVKGPCAGRGDGGRAAADAVDVLAHLAAVPDPHERLPAGGEGGAATGGRAVDAGMPAPEPPGTGHQSQSPPLDGRERKMPSVPGVSTQRMRSANVYGSPAAKADGLVFCLGSVAQVLQEGPVTAWFRRPGRAGAAPPSCAP